MNIKTNPDALNLLFDQKIYIVDQQDQSINQEEATMPEVEEKVEKIKTEESKPSEQNTNIKTPTNNETVESEKKESPIPIPYLGQNEKKVWMVFNGSSISNMPREQKITFLNILKSIGLEFTDIACTGLEEFEAGDLDNLDQRIDFKHLILWGVDAANFDLKTPIYQMEVVREKTIINLPKFEDVFGNTDVKRKVWECIKNFSA